MVENALLRVQPIAQRKAGVEQDQPVGFDTAGQACMQGQGIGHGIAYPSRTLAFGQGSDHVGDDLLLIAGIAHLHRARHACARCQRILAQVGVIVGPARCQWIRWIEWSGRRQAAAAARIRGQQARLHAVRQRGR